MTQDHERIAARIDGFYEAISGPSGHAHDWGTLASLFIPGASIVVFRPEGPLNAATVDTYVDRLKSSLTDRDFYERGFGYRIEVRGDIAQVWSRYEASPGPDFTEIQRTGTNLIQFARRERDWKIAGMIYQDD